LKESIKIDVTKYKDKSDVLDNLIEWDELIKQEVLLDRKRKINKIKERLK
jgi:hypothetical protein